MSTTSPTPSHRTRWWALGLLLAVCAVAFTYPQLRELHHMNQLPRNMKLTAFDPHRPGFECVHEATKVPPIDPEAQEWLEQGLALSSYDQWYEDRDWAGAAALWHKAAERRHWKAMMNLVSLYANGRGEGKLRVERDLERAVLITEEAMQLGIPAAFDFMGTLHWEGRGVNGDASRAYAFWQLAADMGSPSAMAYLGKALQASYNNPSQGFWENRKVALKMLECGLAQGHGQAAYELGVAIDGDDKELDEDYGRALLALHSAVKFGSAEAAVYMAASFWGGEPLVGRAKDPVRGERYSAFGEALRRNPDLRLPNLDKVLPLPPAQLPPWDGQRQSLIDAAKGVRLAPQPLTTSAHQLPPQDRAHIPPGHSVQLPAELASLARRTPLDGITTVWLGSRYSSDVTRAPHTGYWQARVLPDRPHHNPRAPQLRSEFAQLPPLRFQQGEFMRLTMGHTNVPHEDWVHNLVDWHFVGVALPQRLPPDWLARADLVHALTTATRTTCMSGERCPQSGIWQPFARDKAHPLAHLLSTANLNETWKRQAFVPQGEPLPSLSAQGLPLDDEQVGWWLLHASEAGCYAPAQKA